MPPAHGTTRSENQLSELFEGCIGQEQGSASVRREERDDRLPSFRRGVEARPAQRLADLWLVPQELGGNRILDHDDSVPAVGETGGRGSGEHRLPGAEQLPVWPVASAYRKRKALG